MPPKKKEAESFQPLIPSFFFLLVSAMPPERLGNDPLDLSVDRPELLCGPLLHLLHHLRIKPQKKSLVLLFRHRHSIMDTSYSILVSIKLRYSNFIDTAFPYSAPAGQARLRTAPQEGCSPSWPYALRRAPRSVPRSAGQGPSSPC